MSAINGINIFNTNINTTKELIGKNATESFNSPHLMYGIFNSKENGVNGKIDEGVFQGKKGDCWLISGILSLSYTKDGQKLIKDAISKDENGDYEVYFKGINKKYKVTKEELQKNNVSTLKSGFNRTKSEYSTGDDDMLLIELALEKVADEGKIPIDTTDGITGGSAYYLYQLFTDREIGYANTSQPNKVEELLNYYQTYQNSCAATLGVQDAFSRLEGDHAYAIKSYNGNVITLVNPWNSTKEVKITKGELLRNLGNYDISVADNEIQEEQSWLQEYYA